MRQVKEKSFWTVFGVATVLMTAGCSVNPTFDRDSRLDPVRPFTNETSEASKLLVNFDGVGLNNTAIICVIDKALWEDELELDHGGFDPREVYRASKKEKSALAMIKEYGTVPVILRDRIQVSRDPDAPGVGSIAINSMLMNSNWSTLGHAGLGIGLGTLFTWVSAPKTTEDLVAEQDDIKIAALRGTKIMFPLVKKYPMTNADACQSEFSDECLKYKETLKNQAIHDARQIAMKEFTQAAVNLGFRPVGEPGQTTYKNGVKAIYQMLENEALGCPKVETGTFSFDYCRVTFRENDGTQISPDFTRAAVMVKPRSHVGLATPCVSDAAKAEDLKDKLIKELIKLSPSSMAYVAAEKIDGKWTPQKVVDYRGDHYFVVPVKRNK